MSVLVTVSVVLPSEEVSFSVVVVPVEESNSVVVSVTVPSAEVSFW